MAERERERERENNRAHFKSGLTLAALLVALAAATAPALGAGAMPDEKVAHINADAQKYNGARPDYERSACFGDATTLLYPYPGSGGWTQSMERNDDHSTGQLTLGFTFLLFGDQYTSCWINNNGNISFTGPYGTYTPVGFPSSEYVMVAAFWADEDTRCAGDVGTGLVYHKFLDSDSDGDTDTLVVTWDNVGYFDSHCDLLNTFQIAVSDGSNPIMGIGITVCFTYANMCWTTGDASGGSGGFGGSAATVGCNRGDGVDYFQLGRFDHAGTDYDGPYGSNDGVSYLDGQHLCINTVGDNICPIPQNFPPGNELTVAVADVLNLTLQFISPESSQATTVTIDDINGAQEAGLALTNTPGNPATVQLNWATEAGDVGDYVLTFHATDDYAPPCTTDISLTIHVATAGACCAVDGSCAVTAQANCSGIWHGEWTTCTPNPCPAPQGACCYPDGSCAMMTQMDCTNNWLGIGTTCTPNLCPPLKRCCFPDGNCQMLIEPECLAAGGVPGAVGSTCDPVFTYTASTCTNPFEDISVTGTHVTGAQVDDGGAAVTLPFTFNFFQVPETSIGITSNGYLTFSTVYTDLSPDPIPTAATPNDLIAILWRDLNATTPPAGGVQYEDRTSPDRFIVQWTNVPQYGSPTILNTFQAVLYEGSDCIEFRYQTVMTTGYRAGIENATGSVGTEVTMMVAPGACIRLCPGLVPVCPQPGACCFLDGYCEVVLPAQCAAAFGTYLGISTDCDLNPCPPPCVQCPPEGVLEGEPLCGPDYVDTYNGGCNSIPAMYQPINFGDLVCGESGTFLVGAAQSRDADWYEVQLEAPKRIVWTVTATFPVLIFVLDGNNDCPTGGPVTIASATATACVPATITTGCLPAGRYWLWVGPQVSTGIPCGAPYVATATTLDCFGACCLPDGTCLVDLLPADCQTQGGLFRGPNTDCGVANYVAETCSNPLEDISATGTPGPTGDDAGLTAPLGFTFSFYGNAYTTVWMCTNGFLQFGGANNTTFSDVAIPNPAVPNNMIAVLWDDFSVTGAGQTDYITLGDSGSRRFIAQWTSVPQLSGSDANTFQTILYEADNCIEFRYGTYATTDCHAGVENADGTVGLDVTAQVAQDGCIKLYLAYESPCPQLTGACCLDYAGGCQVLTETDCLMQAGRFRGVGTTCSGPEVCGCKGDCNCDGIVDFDDINSFVAAISGFTPCNAWNCDVDDNGVVDFDDISPFVWLLSQGAECP